MEGLSWEVVHKSTRQLVHAQPPDDVEDVGQPTQGECRGGGAPAAETAVVKSEDQFTILSGGEDTLQKAETASQAAYKGGMVSLIEVLDADRRLLDTRDAKIQAQTGAARAAVSAFRALGGGWNAVGGQVKYARMV